jgi:3-(3-hydroxy-phenyl)propionate hydroxylase
MVYGLDLDFPAPCHVVQVQAKDAAPRLGRSDVLVDADGLIAKRYDMQLGTAYLLRPDQHVCARWRQVTPAKLQAALDLALGKTN